MRNITHFVGRRGITAIMSVVLVLVPMGAYAQTDDLATLVAQLQAQIAALQAQIQSLQAEQGVVPPPPPPLTPTPSASVSCPTISRTLYLGLRGEDVSGLQQFLRESGYFTYSTNTGYFGPATERAVQLFQSAQGIVSSGDAETTGYGVVGPGTRAAIAAVCSSGIPPSTTQTGAITVRVSSVTTAPGETVDIPVTVSNPSSFVSYDAKIYFNPNVISILGIEKNGTLSSDMALASNIVGGNVLQISAASSEKIAQSGTLFTIRAKALTAGLSNLTISSFVFDDGSPSAYPISGSVTVRSSQDDTPYVPPPSLPPILPPFGDTTPPEVSLLVDATGSGMPASGFRIAAKVVDNESIISYVRVSVWDYARQQWTVNDTPIDDFFHDGDYWYYDVKPEHITPGAQLFIRVRAYNTAGLGSYDQRTVTVAQATTQPSMYDYTGDGVTDKLDEFFLRDLILESKTCPTGTVCDVNNDKQINVADVLALVAYLNANRPTITVLSPNGGYGEEWAVGETYEISFSTSNMPAGEYYYVYLDQRSFTGQDTSTLIEGRLQMIDGSKQKSIKYTVPSSMPLGGLYTVSVTNLGNVSSVGDISDSSDSSFSIVAPTTQTSITVTSPNGGETLQRGSGFSITWTQPTITPAPVNVDIFLVPYQAPCTGPAACILGFPAPLTIVKNYSDNPYRWIVGNVQEANRIVNDGVYYIKVCRSGTTGGTDNCDQSDSYFKITTSTTQPSITVTSPNGGEIYSNAPGKEIKFTWQAVGGNRVAAFLEFPDKALCYIGQTDASVGYMSFYPYTPSTTGFPCNVSLYPIDRYIVPGQYKWIAKLYGPDGVTGTVIAQDESDAPFSIVAPTTQTKSVSLSTSATEGKVPFTPTFTGTLANFPSCGNTVTWTWGDNTSDSVSEYCYTTSSVTASRAVTRSHAYQTPGAYLARLTVGGMPSNDVTISVSTTASSPGSLTISTAGVPIAQSITTNTLQFTFANYIFDARDSGEDVRIINIPLKLSGTGQATGLSNCKLYVGNSALTTGANVVNPTSQNSNTTFNFDGLGYVVPKGTIPTLSLKCDVSASANGTYAWGLDGSQQANYNGVRGVTSGQIINETLLSSAGQTMTVAQSGSLSATIDVGTSGSLPYREIWAGTQNVELVRIKFSALSGESISLRSVALQLSDTAYNTPIDLVNQQVTLWDGTTQIGTAVFAAGDTAVSMLSPVTIPQGGSKIITIKGSISPISASGPLTAPGDILKVDYDGDAAGLGGTYGVGVSSGSTIIPSGGDTYSNGIKIIDVVPLPLPPPTTPASSLIVLSPNGGEQWKQGLLKSIKWYGVNLGTVTLNIDLLNEAGAVVRNIGTNVSNGQPYYSWTVPADVAAGKFMVKISSSDTTASDSSDLAFAVLSSTQSAASLTVTSPIKGDNWSSSSLKPVITWQSTNIYSSNAVTIGLKNLSTGSQYLVLRDTFNDGSQAISISTIPSGTYSLFLYSVVGNDVVYGWGDAFTIGSTVSSAPAPTANGLASTLAAIQALIDQIAAYLKSF